jgi:hypothetical protein
MYEIKMYTNASTCRTLTINEYISNIFFAVKVVQK